MISFYSLSSSLGMLVVGLTGGIATGKSTVSKLLATRHNLPIIDADILARDVIAPGTEGFDVVVKHFGPDRVLNKDGTLDRAAVGDIIFKDADERRWLNGVVHPRVRKAMFMGVLKAWMRGEWCVVLDVPLLIEADLWKWVGEVVVVYINDKLQLQRLLSRNTELSESQAKDRMSSQMPVGKKAEFATTVIDNSGSFTDLEVQVDRAVAKWRRSQGNLWWRICWILPPVGIAAGWVCLFNLWLRARRRERKTRGERSSKPESHEMSDLRRRRVGEDAKL